MTKKYLKRVVVFMFLLGIFAVISGCSTQVVSPDDKNISIITVDGMGKIITKPDMVEIRVSVVSEGKDKNVQEKNAVQTQKIIEALNSLGLNKEEIKTENVNFYPLKRWNEKNGEEITGYRAENILQIKTRKIEKAGQIVDRAVEYGAQSVGNLTFSLSNQGKEDLLDKAIEKAVLDARNQAEAAAKAAGVEIIGIKNIRVVKNSSTRGPIYLESKMKTAEAVDTPILPKDTEYMVNVNVDFLIK